MLADVVLSVYGKGLPETRIVIEPSHLCGEMLGLTRQQHIQAIRQPGSFGRDRSGNYRQPTTHAEIDLALDPGTVPEGCDGDPATLEQWTEILDVTQHPQGFAMESENLGRRGASYDVGGHAGHRSVD